MTQDTKWNVRVNAAQLKKAVSEATFAAVQEVFEIDMKAEAQATSPVSPKYPSIPASRGEKRIDEGTNRRSIDTEVKRTATGVEASLFSQSGHGGYLEVGTSRMPARPYLFPAFNKYRVKLGKLLAVNFAKIKVAK